MLLFDGPRQHDDLACAARRQRETLASSRSRRPASEASVRSRPTSTRNRARCDSSASFAPNARATSASLGTSPGHASPSARASANNTGRLASETTVPRVTHDMTARVHDERLRRQQRFDLLEQEESLLATRNQARRGRVQDEGCAFDLRRQRRDAARGAPRARPGRAQRAPPSSGGAASRSPRPPARGRPSTRAGRARGRARRARARPRRGARSGGGAGPRDTAHARRSPGRRALRASPAPRRAPSQASPGRARRARSRPRRRRTSRGPRPLSDRRRAPHCRRRAFARTRSPSCAIAMPRSASAGASSRRATRFSAPRGSPAASARAAAVISESIGIPPHLSLPPFDARR